MSEHLSEHQLLELRAEIIEHGSDQANQMQQHLADCAECLRRQQKLDALFFAATPQADQPADMQLSRQLQQRRAQAFNNSRKASRKMWGTGIAASLLGAAIIAYFSAQQFGRTPPAEAITVTSNSVPSSVIEPVVIAQPELEDLVSSVEFFLWLDEIEASETGG